MENVSSNIKSRIFSYSVLTFTLFVVITSLSSIVFPRLIVRLASNLQDNSINPLEPGLVSIPFLIVNLILIGIIILNKKGKLPSQITKIFGFIKQFDVSWKVALVTIIVLYAIYLAFTLSHIYSEETYDDYQIAKYQGNNWSFSIDNITFGFKYFLLHASIIIFKNIRMIPLISSFLMLLLVYFTTLELTKKRIGSLIAVIMVLQSNNFLTYDSTASYANFWIFFYLLSLFLIFKKVVSISCIFYIISFFKSTDCYFYSYDFIFYSKFRNIQKKKDSGYYPVRYNGINFCSINSDQGISTRHTRHII